MADRIPAMDDATTKFGLLMESATVHQKLAETHLERLQAHTQGLDTVVRDEIRRTLLEELQMLTAEGRRAAEILRRIGRGVTLRGTLWSLAIVILSTGIPVAIMRWTLPSATEVAALRVQRDQLAATVEDLQRRGGRVQLRLCGESARLCVHVDKKAPSYGEKADYLVVAGY
jgi:hypothetical protein